MTYQIRLMQAHEADQVLQAGKASFSWVEALFMSKPDWAYIIEEDGKFAGAMLLEDIPAKEATAYIDFAYIIEDYRGKGLGQYLYQGVKDELDKLGYQRIFATVRADNVASWKNIQAMGLKRVSLWSWYQTTGWEGLSQILRHSPILFSYGMDLYIYDAAIDLKEKAGGLNELIAFLLVNALIALISSSLGKNSSPFWMVPVVLLIILSAMTLSRYLISRFWLDLDWQFRNTNGGLGLALIFAVINFLGIPIHGTWHPSSYRNTKALAMTELGSWALLILMAIYLSPLDHTLLRITGQIAKSYLLIYYLPFYPMDELGGKRIYRYSKVLYLLVAVLSLLVVCSN